MCTGVHEWTGVSEMWCSVDLNRDFSNSEGEMVR